MSPHLLIAESRDFSSQALGRLREVARVTAADLNRAQLLSRVAHADALWVRLRSRIDGEVFAAAPRLKVIITPTTGLNHIDLEAARRRDIEILSLRGETEFLKTVRATAEHTLALILALLRHLPAAANHVRQGGWNRDLFQGRELHQKTIGIVGYGRLGQLVAEHLEPFQVRVLVADPRLNPDHVTSGVDVVPLEQLLAQADLVSLHASYSDAARGFFGPRQFQLMKPGAWFVNTARGELVSESALLEALRSRRLAGAALDVLCDETSGRHASHPLVAYARDHQNLIITPHVGGCTAESMEKTELFLAERFCRHWHSEALRPVDSISRTIATGS